MKDAVLEGSAEWIKKLKNLHQFFKHFKYKIVDIILTIKHNLYR